ncbi:MAG: ATP-binding cassette domain-containing protein, partial [Lachnospiraceae bacterium]|nr:ATP-binding cassette domain-containing protein [Lachnospiraceae bacterium]
ILLQPEEAKKSIGYLPELPPVYQDMTVYEYLQFVAELKKVKKSERKEQLEQIMEQTKVHEVKDRLIKNLSKGYKQRVGLAQAIVGYPEVIILDEPMVGLDPKQIIEIRELIRELAKKHTVILSSHILSEISAICDHIMIISKGKLVASDTPEGLMKLLNGGSRLSLVVKGSQERLDKVLHTIEIISEISYMTAKDEGCVKAELYVEDDEDIRVELFHKLAAEDLVIMELTLSEKSLEEVFLELTGEEKEEQTDDSDI